MAEILREEWRGDVFRNDLLAATEPLKGLSEVPREYPDTVTLFFADGDHPIDGIRARAYTPSIGELGSLEDLPVRDLSLIAKSGNIKGGIGNVALDGLVFSDRDHGFRPQTLRVAERRHYFSGEEGDETRRITLDETRRVFKVCSDGELKFLGDLGPRIEVKSPSISETNKTVTDFGFEDFGYNLPFRSTELLLRERLRDAIPEESYLGLPEVELKLDAVHKPGNQPNLGMLIREFVRSNPDFDPITPDARLIHQFRRFHAASVDGKRLTIVETLGGKIHEKVKGLPRQEGSLIVRDTVAEGALTSDVDGNNQPVDEYLQKRGISEYVTYTKSQKKLPFVIRGPGRIALHITHDYCEARDGRGLEQVELEFIGADTSKQPPIELVMDSMSRVGKMLQAFGAHNEVWLNPSQIEKHEFFTSGTRT